MANTIHVSPSGSDASGSGGGNAPYATIMKAVGVAQSGDTIMVGNGTYLEAIVIPASLSGVADRPTVMRGESRDATIVDGEFQRGYLFCSEGAEYFHLENMTFRNARFPYWNRGAVSIVSEALRGSNLQLKGWRFEDVVMEKSQADGLATGKAVGAVVKNCIIRDNFQTGASALGCHDVRFIGCTICRNNAGWTYNPWQEYMSNEPVQPDYHVSLDPHDGKYYVSCGFGCGGVKIFMADSIIFESCKIYGNSGPGVWYDGDCRNQIVLNCEIYGQFNHAHNEWGNYPAGGTGIMFEVSATGPFQVEGCHLYSNEVEDINMCEASNGIVRNNVITGEICDGCWWSKHGGAMGRLVFRDGWRSGGQLTGRSPIRNVLIENNIFQNMYIESRRGGPSNWNADTLDARNIAFHNNQWQGTEPWIHEWEDRPAKEIIGLDNMRAAWGTFLTDTYQTEVTANRERFAPAYPASQTRVAPFMRSSCLFDVKGRRIQSAAPLSGVLLHSRTPSCGMYIFLDEGNVARQKSFVVKGALNN